MPVVTDELYDNALAVVGRLSAISTSGLMLRLGCGADDAICVLDRLESYGLVSVERDRRNLRKVLFMSRPVPVTIHAEGAAVANAELDRVFDEMSDAASGRRGQATV